MMSSIAKADLAALRSAGCNPTDDEVVELNDLGARIERGKDTTVLNHPRTAFAGSIILHEPTVGGIEWWELYGKDSFVLHSSRLYGYFFMLAHCRDMAYLDALKKSADVARAVRRWKRTIDATESELWRAMLYVKFGTDIPNPDGPQDAPDGSAVDVMWRKLIMVSGAMHMSPEDLKTCTDSDLTGLLVQASLHSRLDVKKSVADLYIKYRKTLKAIEDRCMAEVSNDERGA